MMSGSRQFVYCLCIQYGDSCMHPSDQHLRDDILANGNHIYEYVGSIDMYELLRINDIVFRVRTGQTRPMKSGPAFSAGDIVRTLPPHRERVTAIRSVEPHLERRVPIYFLDIGGRRKHSWFEEAHLELVHPVAGSRPVTE